jgi:hypothetical protein
MLGGPCFLVNDKMCAGIGGDENLNDWLELCLDYNPRARLSKKKTTRSKGGSR